MLQLPKIQYQHLLIILVNQHHPIIWLGIYHVLMVNLVVHATICCNRKSKPSINNRKLLINDNMVVNFYKFWMDISLIPMVEKIKLVVINISIQSNSSVHMGHLFPPLSYTKILHQTIAWL